MKFTRRSTWALAILVGLGLLVIGWAYLHVERDTGHGIEVTGSASKPAPAQPVAPDASGTSDAKAPATLRGQPVAVDGSVAVPLRYQFAGVTRVQTGHDFEDWMSHYSPSDQKIIRAFNKRNFGVYRHRTPEQIAWMAANGYPMPEDVLAAQAMGTPRLRQLAEAGNDKAAFLLKNRRLREVANMVQAGSLKFGEVMDKNPRIAHDLAMLQQQVLGSESPFKAYVAAQAAMVEVRNPASTIVDAQVIAALEWAMTLGDMGARDMLARFVTAEPARTRLRTAYRDAAMAAVHYLVTFPKSFGRYGCGISGVSSYPRGDPDSMH